MEAFNLDTLFTILFRFSLNMISVTILLWLIYLRSKHKTGFMFNYAIMAVIAFLVCFFLGNINLSVGLGLGLFAIFAIFRYRTDKIPVKEMAYLFITIGLSLINSLVSINLYYVILVNVLVLLCTWSFETFARERKKVKKHLNHCKVVYKKIKNVDPSKEDDLYQDLRSITGLEIKRVKVQKIEIEKHRVHLKIYY